MENNNDLLHRIKKLEMRTNQFSTENLATTSDLQNLGDVVEQISDEILTLQTNMPTKTSDLQNDSNFLTNANLIDKENTTNKTTSISANPNDTKYPTEKAVADYVTQSLQNISTSSGGQVVPTKTSDLQNDSGFITQTDDQIQNMQIAELQTQIANLGGIILLNQPEIPDGTRLTSVAEITALNNQFDTSNFNNSTHEKLPFTSKGTTGPTAVVFFRQAPFIALTPTIELKFFLRDIPNGVATLPCIITLNNTIISTTALNVIAGENYQATITLSNLTTQAFNKLEINFNDNSLVNMQLDYLDISITNTQNCIILNRDDSFSLSGLKNLSNNVYTSSTKMQNLDYKFLNATNADINNVLNPTNNYLPRTDEEGNDFCLMFCALYYSLINSDNFTTITTYTNSGIIFNISNTTHDLWITAPYTKKILSNVIHISVSVHNGEVNRNTYLPGISGIRSTTTYVVGVQYDFGVFIAHAMSTGVNYRLSLNSINIPLEFVGACGINDWHCRKRTDYVFNVGYIVVHKTGTILFFPKVTNSYCIKIGKGTQVNAYLSEDGLSVNVYYYNGIKVIKKTISRPAMLENSSWSLTENIEEFSSVKEIREWHTGLLCKDGDFNWTLTN